MFKVTVVVEFDSEDTAREAMSNMEEEAGKLDGNLISSEVEDDYLGPDDAEIYGAGVK